MAAAKSLLKLAEEFGYPKGTKLVGIIKHHKGNSEILVGTMDYFKHGYFGYTLDCGHSWNPKINTEPKSLKSLVKNINDSYYEKREYHDSVDGVEPAELKEILNKENAKELVRFVGLR